MDRPFSERRALLESGRCFAPLAHYLELLAGLPSAEQEHWSAMLCHFSDGRGRPQPEGVGPGGAPWTENLYKAVAFRCHKKLVLHDAVERLGPPE